MKKLVLIACCLLICCLMMPVTTHAVNSVVVESKAVAVSATGVQVGVFVTNDLNIQGAVVALEIRSVSGGAFIVGGVTAPTSTWTMPAANRMGASPLGNAGDTWPGASITNRKYATPSIVCSGPISSSYATSVAQWDGISPDAVLLATVSQGDPGIGEDIFLTPGADAAGTANASLLFRFNVNANNGCFVIDTCCVTPANHLAFVDDQVGNVQPDFTPGFVTVGSGSCAAVPNLPPIAICKNVTDTANGSCQGVVAAAEVNNGSTDPELGALTFALVPAGPYALGVTPVSLIVTDPEGAADTCAATITVVDVTAPVISCPGPIAVQCGVSVPAAYADAAAFVAAGGSVSDNCSIASVALLDQVSDGNTCPQVLTRRYVVTDGSGNKDTCSQTVTVDDTIAPVITDCPNDTTIHLPNGTTSTVVLYSDASISDNCNNVSIIHSPLSNSTFNVGTTQVRLIASDLCGNADTCFFDVTIIEDPAGNTPPNAVCQDLAISAGDSCEAFATANMFNNGSSDTEDGTNLILSVNPEGPYPLGQTQVWLIVMDQGGLKDSCQATITVADATVPTISCPPQITQTCDNSPSPYADLAAFIAAGGSASDNCDQSLTFSYQGEQCAAGQLCERTCTRTYRVTDDAGNFAECQQTRRINDSIPPVLGPCPTNISVVVSAGSTDTIITFSLPTATDDCAVPNVNANPASGASFPVGQTTVIVIASDNCGNLDTCSFTVTVTEQVADAPPIANCANRTANATSTCDASANIDNGSYDPDTGPVTLTQVPAGPYPLGQTLVTLWVKDDEGDSSSCTATVTVVDVTAPVVTCPSDIEMNNDPGECGADFVGKFENPTASDNCDQDVTISLNPSYGSFFPVGTTTITVIATDDAGNADTCEFDLTVTDNELPKVNCPVDISVSNDPGQCGAIVNFIASGSDNCPGVDVSTSQSTGTMFPVGTTVVWTVAVDKAGNKDSCSFNVTVNDTEDPVVTCSGDIVVSAPFGAPGTNVNWNTSATDNCPGHSLNCDANPNSFFLIGGPYTVCCTATDKDGNTDSCCFTITVLPGSPTAPGPHVDVDTLDFKVTCGCDTQAVDVYCVQPDGKGFDTSECLYYVITDVPGVHGSPSPGVAPGSVDIVGCRSDLEPDTYSGWVFIKNAAGQSTDSFWVNLVVNADEPGVVVDPDTLVFTYTGDIFNDKLCLPVSINSTGCGETCWELVGSTGDWVWVDPTDGQTPGTTEICVDPCAFEAGTYYYTLTFCPCVKGRDAVAGCDQLVIKLNVVNPPVMVVDPLIVIFDDTCGEKSNPLPIAITNAGGGVLDWHAFETADWFGIIPEDGSAPDDTLWVYLEEEIKCPEVCDTLIDSICVIGNKRCAINGQQWVRVELIICPPPDSVQCDSLCGWVYDSDCIEKGDCGIDGAHVELWSSFPDGYIIDSTLTSFGQFCFDVEPGVEYDIRVWKKGYCTDTVDNWSCEDGPLVINLDPLDFVPLPNWPYFTDYYSTNATSEGWPILPGDVIYATDPQGVICGIFWVTAPGTYLIHVLGDDIKTPGDEGAIPGDSITLWLNCKCPVTAPDTWVNFGSFLFDAAWDCRPTGQCCVLCEGWNMWSFNIQVPSTLREDVLATIDLNYDAVRSGLCDYGSISWFDGRPVNDLTDVTNWYGYDIHMLAEDTVCLEGQQVDPQTPIYLCAGWNYIPYLPVEMDALSSALSSLDGNYSHIFTMQCGFGVQSWNETRPPQNNDLICMESCKGYWIKMKSDDTLIYPADPDGCDFNAKLGSSSSSSRVTATPMVADYYAPVSNLNAGSTISVRNSSGTLIGETTVGANGAFLLHVYGDVPQTSAIEGAVQGEELSFSVDGLAASASRNILWTDRDNQAIDLTVEEAGGSIPTEYSLLQNYPNPFNAGTVLPFTMKDASEWTLTVYNIMGQTVQTFNGFDAAGTVRVSWNGLDQNGSTVPSGVYFYRVTTPEWSATKKMTLLK